MSVTNLDHVNLSVHDFDESVAWYGRIFGFELVEDEVNEHGVRWGVLRRNDAMLCIYHHPEAEHTDGWTLRDRGVHSVAHFGLRVRDRKQWEAVVEREGVEVNFGGARKWPHSTAWYVADPTGWEIEVVYWDDDTIAFG